MRIDRVVLEHHGDVPLLGLEVVHHAPVDSDLAAADLFEASNHPKRRGLAAAGGSDQNDELAILNRKVNSMDHGGAPIGFDQAIDFNGRHQRAPRSAVKREWRSSADAASRA